MPMEFIRADIVARAKKLAGFDVYFNTGTDEHGSKVYEKAKQSGDGDPGLRRPECGQVQRDLSALGVMPEANFVRTTDPHHIMRAQEILEDRRQEWFIYKKDYSIKYCVAVSSRRPTRNW